jgi:hypothetical protein
MGGGGFVLGAPGTAKTTHFVFTLQLPSEIPEHVLPRHEMLFLGDFHHEFIQEKPVELEEVALIPIGSTLDQETPPLGGNCTKGASH